MNIIRAFLTKNPCYQANLKRVDSRYRDFQDKGASGLSLHSVGCPQPSAKVFVEGWNNANKEVCVHAFIDANSGDVHQTLPWNYRGWHLGGIGNNTHIGIEMCESSAIKYVNGVSFDVLDAKKAKADCRRTYDSAVELFAMLCAAFKLDPEKDIVSHREAGKRGIASGHVDPEHYWAGVGSGYTMDGFRKAVKEKMERNAEEKLAASKEKEEKPKVQFDDVEPNRFYTDAVAWAAENGIVNGRDSKRFVPNEPATRGEIVTMLYRFYKLINRTD